MIQRRTTRSRRTTERTRFKIPAQGKLLEDIEREAVAITLKITGGNQAAAARLLGISRPTLAKRMARERARSDSSE